MNSLVFSSLLLFSGLSASVGAQQPLLADDFEDDVIGAEWSIGLTLGAWVFVEESRGSLRATGSLLTQGPSGSYFLSQQILPHVGAFQLDVPLDWTADPFGGVISTSSVFVRLVASDQSTIAAWELNDSSQSGGGDLEFGGTFQVQSIPNLPIDGEGMVRLQRSAADELSFTYSGPLGPETGTLGFDGRPVTGVEVSFGHSGFGSPPFTEIALQSLTLGDTLTPFLVVSELQPGLPGTLTMLDASPFLPVAFAYSVTGGGPTPTIFGELALSSPIRSIPPVFSDLSGAAQVSLPIPFQASGRQVWFHGIDLVTGELSNPATATVL